ncbi:integrase [Vibrio vulnificus]|nr:integrase [Vibrio vulnificus]
MPIYIPMTIRNLKDGSKKPWLCECYPNGRTDKRIRKMFATKGEATTYELHLMKEVDDKPWMGSKPDSRRLSDIVALWYSHYGCTLVNGDVVIQKFRHMVQAMGNPVASAFSSKMYSDFRSKRMSGDLVFVEEWIPACARMTTSDVTRYSCCCQFAIAQTVLSSLLLTDQCSAFSHSYLDSKSKPSSATLSYTLTKTRKNRRDH